MKIIRWIWSGVLLVVLTFAPGYFSAVTGEDCPEQADYGEPSANRLTMQSKDGVRNVYFQDVPVVVEKETIRIFFPPFGYEGNFDNQIHHWMIKVDEFKSGQAPGSFSAVKRELESTMVEDSIHCFGFPDLPRDLEESGALVVKSFDSSGTETSFQATFSINRYDLDKNGTDKSPRAGYSGTIRTNQIIRIQNSALGEGNKFRQFGDEKTASEGYAKYNEITNELELAMKGAEGFAGFELDDFPGEPGVYKHEGSFGEVEFYVIDEFSADRIVGQKRVVKEDGFPGMENVTPETAKNLGKYEATFDIGSVYVIPAGKSVIVPKKD